MSSDNAVPIPGDAGRPPVAPADSAAGGADGRPRLRVWFPVGLTVLFWAFVAVTAVVEMPTFTRFLARMGVFGLVLLLFLAWWVFNRNITRRDRLRVVAAAVVSLVLAKLLSHRTLGPFPVMYGLPLLLTAWVAWLVLARRGFGHCRWTSGLIVVLLLSPLGFALLRMEGLNGSGEPDLRWRWSPSAEERYLARQPAAPAGPSAGGATTTASALTARPGDWPGFRGAGRDAVVRGISIATNWDAAPPREVWRRPIGPGWSSVAVVDGRLFTQEQRGEEEAVVCLDAATGAEIWSHREPGRFWDSLSSTGPRATPTFADGRIYAQGATGTLVCLDAATGSKVWSRNVLADSGNKLPDWGLSSSPLVAHGLVIVYAGGPADKSGAGRKALAAYKADSGEPAWSVEAGAYSYSSAQLAQLAGREQVLFVHNDGLASVDPASGSPLWAYAAPGMPARSCQPLSVGNDQLLVQLGMEAPTDLVEVVHANGAFTASKRWSSRNLKPSFNDFVVHDGFVYGFDGNIFCCVDLKTGDRKWKKGRYGTGQVLLFAEQPVLLVVSDGGEAVLVAANPNVFEELGRFQAVTGKTWNHPAVAGGRLYVRNAEEIACYELAPRQPK